jgi:hypothetical protein
VSRTALAVAVLACGGASEDSALGSRARALVEENGASSTSPSFDDADLIDPGSDAAQAVATCEVSDGDSSDSDDGDLSDSDDGDDAEDEAAEGIDSAAGVDKSTDSSDDADSDGDDSVEGDDEDSDGDTDDSESDDDSDGDDCVPAPEAPAEPAPIE